MRRGIFETARSTKVKQPLREAFTYRGSEDLQRIANKVAAIIGRKFGRKAVAGHCPYYFSRDNEQYIAYFAPTDSDNVAFRINFRLDSERPSTRIASIDLYTSLKSIEEPDITLHITDPNMNIVQIIKQVDTKLLTARNLHAVQNAGMDTLHTERGLEQSGVEFHQYEKRTYAQEKRYLIEASKKSVIQSFLQAEGGSYADFVRWATAQGEPIGSAAFFQSVKRELDAHGGAPSSVQSGKGYEIRVPTEEEPLWAEEDAAAFEDIEENEAIEKFEELEVVLRKMANDDPNFNALFVYGSPGVGKEQPHSAKILTPAGWTTMGDIKVGDVVNTPDGTTANVVNKFPQGVKPVFEITLRDGSKTRAGADHLWRVQDSKRTSKAEPFKLMTTADMIDAVQEDSDGEFFYKDSAGAPYYRFRLPYCSPQEFERSEQLPIDPYTLGLLLGDGGMSSSSATSFTSIDPELVEAFRQGILQIDSTAELKQYPRAPKADWKLIRVPKFNQIVKDLELRGKRSWEKHIPEMYKFATIEDRVALIQGLVDTDGYVAKAGATQFYTTSEQLANDFTDIVRSLGGRCHTRVVENKTYLSPEKGRIPCRDSYSITFSLPVELGAPTRLTRKKDRYESRTRQNRTKQAIVDIKLVGQEESSCIMIDHPDHLYITDDFIVTHNTFSIKKVFQEEEATLQANDLKVEIKTGAIAGFTGLITLLFEHRDNYILVLDDNDEILKNRNGVNVLKGAMNTNIEDRRVQYTVPDRSGFAKDKDEEAVPAVIDDEVFDEDLEETIHVRERGGSYIFEKALRPTRVAENYSKDNETLKDFYFRSKIIFISNLLEIPSAIDDRCYSIDMVFTYEQIMEMVKNVMEFIDIEGVSLDIRMDVYEFLKRSKYAIEYKLGIPVQMTFRKFRNACLAWEGAVNGGLGVTKAKKLAYKQLKGSLGKS